MTEIHYEINFLQYALHELKSYLLSSEIYWPLGIRSPIPGRPYPRMTLGWVLLFRQRLRAVPSGQSVTIQEIHHKVDRARNRWRVAWGKKASVELSARLRLWNRFVNEYRSDPRGHHDRYPYEVQRRAMLELLISEVDGIPGAEGELLGALDAVVRNRLIGGDFVWDLVFQPAFPKDPYWYLYGALSEQAS